jgi:hypothetical protein
VVAVLVRVEDLGDGPALVLGGLETLLVVEGIDGKRLAGLAARDQVVEIAVGVRGPICLTIMAWFLVTRSFDRGREVTQASYAIAVGGSRKALCEGAAGRVVALRAPFFELRARLAASARPSSAGACAASRSTSSRNHATKA